MTEPKAYSYMRFSSKKQEKGDSTARQADYAEEYAKAKGLILDDSLSMEDKGLSAFHGVHKSQGTLGVFLRLVEAGKIPQGSTLIVEDFDRLSRQEPLTAMDQFSLLIHAGIRIVTLNNGIEFDRQSIRENPGQLWLSMGKIIQAFQESELKQKRMKSVWKHKREALKNGTLTRKVTSRIPAWLTISEDKTEFIPIPEACQTIKRIFEMKLKGMGGTRIATQLNQDPIAWKPPKIPQNKTGGWRCSYVLKILSNKAVIGEFQPCKMTKQEGRKRQYVPIPEGDSIKDYFPAIIPTDLFYAVQEHIKQNGKQPGNAGGRTQKAENLFVRLVKCGRCKGAMHFLNLGPPPKGGQYLRCDASRRKLGTCNSRAVRYKEFEELFFDNFEELDLSDILPDQNESQEQAQALKQRIDAGNARSRELTEQENNLIDSITTTSDKRIREALDKRLAKVMDEQEAATQEIKDLTQELGETEKSAKEMSKLIDHATELYGLMDQAGDEQARIALRMKLRTQIQKLVDTIEIYPLQQFYKKQQEDQEGIITTMDSKFIEKVRIKFKGSKKSRQLRLVHRFDSLDVDHN